MDLIIPIPSVTGIAPEFESFWSLHILSYLLECPSLEPSTLLHYRLAAKENLRFLGFRLVFCHAQMRRLALWTRVLLSSLWIEVESRTLILSHTLITLRTDVNVCFFRVLCRTVSGKSPLDNLLLSLRILKPSEPWQLTVDVLSVVVLIRPNVSVVDSPLVLSHQLPVPLLFASLNNLAPEILHVSSVLKPCLLLLLPVFIFSLLHLIQDHSGEGLI